MTTFKLRLRKVNQRVLGATIPADVINELDLESGDEIIVNIDNIVKRTTEYMCGVCQCSFVENTDEVEIECTGCGEKSNIIKIADDFTHIQMKGGEDGQGNNN